MRLTHSIPIAVAFALGATLSGCGPTPTSVDTPDIVWDGEPATDDPYAEVVQASSIGQALASNANDYTIRQLTDTTTAERIQRLYDDRVSEAGVGGTPRVWAGPFPQAILQVEESPSGDSAQVFVCDVSTEWYIAEGHEPTLEGARPTPIVATVVDDDGVLKVDSVDLVDGESTCDAEGAALGRFDPAPEPRSVSPDDVRAPLDAVDRR